MQSYGFYFTNETKNWYGTNDMNTIVIFFQIVGSLGLFLFGIKLLSEGLQKTAGDKMKAVLKLMTKKTGWFPYLPVF